MSREEILKDRCKRFGKILNEIIDINLLYISDVITYNDWCFMKGTPELSPKAEKIASKLTRKPIVKPPFGVVSKDMWDRKRQEDLAAAMGRYLEAGKKIPKEWLEEYNEISNDQEKVASKYKTLCDDCALQDLECACDCTREFISKYGPFTPDEINTLVDKEESNKKEKIDE